MHLSVIICTHNPRTVYLQRTLDALRSQTLATTKWELLLIDNCSKEAIEGRFDLSWHPNGRILLESELGLTPARMRGIRESREDILCYVDDDNVLDRDYLEQALKIGEISPHLGCWGGEILPEYEVPPEPWFKGYEGMLAIRPLDRDQWGNAYRYEDAMPCGAGLCVRRSVVDTYLKMCAESPLRKSLDRTGSSTMSCGDVDLAFTAIDMGMGTGRFKALRMLHLIPAGRLDTAYLARLAEGIAESGVYLEHLRFGINSKHNQPRSFRGKLWYWIVYFREAKKRKSIQLASRRGSIRGKMRLESLADSEFS